MHFTGGLGIGAFCQTETWDSSPLLENMAKCTLLPPFGLTSGTEMSSGSLLRTTARDCGDFHFCLSAKLAAAGWVRELPCPAAIHGDEPLNAGPIGMCCKYKGHAGFPNLLRKKKKMFQHIFYIGYVWRWYFECKGLNKIYYQH